MSAVTGHDQVPADARDGDTFACSHCGAAFTYVVCDDGYAEWVQTSVDDQT